jgi:hypothetical protein
VVDFLARFTQLGVHQSRARNQSFAEFGEIRPAGATMHERRSDRLFELVQCTAKDGLADAQPPGAGTDAAGRRHGEQCL